MSTMWPQASMNDRVAEIIELGVVLTNHPDAAEATAALASVANELMEKGADATIEQAIEAAPNCGVAQTLRHAVEAASERVVIYRNGVSTEMSLFAIPIITAFEQNVPASQFEAALSAWPSESRDLANIGGARRLDLAQVALIPKLFRLDELKATPLSVVRKAGISIGTTAASRAGMELPFVKHRAGLKRSTAFLRYLVGQRPRLEHEYWTAVNRGLCERLQDLTKHAVKRDLGLPCQVQAAYTGSFHEALYSGMWLYQEKRLDQIARASRAQARSKNGMEAMVVTHGRSQRFDIRVGFFEGNEAIGGRAYRLSSRPSEELSGCVSRITRRLAMAGIKTNARADLVPEEQGFGLRSGRKAAPLMITIPI
jgi:hypothetical protein